MDKVLVSLTRDYVGQSASSLGMWLTPESVARISAAVMNTTTQGIVKAYKDAAERGPILDGQTQI